MGLGDWLGGRDKGTKARGHRAVVAECGRCGRPKVDGRCTLCQVVNGRSPARGQAAARPKPCGGRLRSGGNCYRTLSPGESCSNPGH